MSDSTVIFRPQVDRFEITSPVAHQLWLVLKQQRDQPGPIKLAIKQYSVDVTSWEMAQLRDLLDAPRMDKSGWGYQLLEALAVQARGLNNLVRLAAAEAEGAEQPDVVRRDLVVDLALCLAVQEEMESVAADFDGAGKTSQAINMSKFIERLRHNTEAIERALGDNERALSVELTREAAQIADSAASGGGAQAPAGPAAAESAELHGSKAAKRRRRALAGRAPLILAGVLTFVLVAGGVYFLPTLTEHYEVADGLHYVRGVVKYGGNPPRMLVTVDPEFWQFKSRADKTSFAFAVAAAVKRKGYTSAAFVLPDGKPVAEWNVKSGVRHF